ncbi:PspC domain-containing protein [Corynebacterium liangguodongii]|uniref:PspC domain-containing protein n=1 Tax=Corynebacterium liangguodongii TaxID=2079535 RepID=A0A2S0WH42_9CORY|nr:PspC domain-containing protein [Corynebacterium liangguodongii]PWB98992.1 PspC domain-containing protein [Corynebacterium liangguodongii]
MKRLTRSSSEKMIAGVCGGLAHYFALDPVLIRLIVAAATVVTGFVPGILAYAVAWFIMPEGV